MHMARVLACLLSAAALAALPAPYGPCCASPNEQLATSAANELATSGNQLLSGGRPLFLQGLSLFDALGDTPPRDDVLDRLRSWGVNDVRVWADWRRPVYDADGRLTAAGARCLVALARRLEARGLVFELVLLRPGQLPGQSAARFTSAAARERAVANLTRAMLPFRLALFDVFNEHDHPHGPITHADAGRLRDIVKDIDPARLVTMSSTGSHIVGPDGSISAADGANLRAEVLETRVDIVAVHLPRTDDWARATQSRVLALRATLQSMRLVVPVYLNEENRAGAGGPTPAAEDYWRAAQGAKAAGAVGWVFHTDAGFDLTAHPFLAALRPPERRALEGLSAHLRDP